MISISNIARTSQHEITTEYLDICDQHVISRLELLSMSMPRNTLTCDQHVIVAGTSEHVISTEYLDICDQHVIMAETSEHVILHPVTM